MKEYFERVISFLADTELSRFQVRKPSEFAQFDLKQYPEKLYKFRSGKQHDYRALIEDFIWLDAPKSFLDPEDARINLGQDDDPETAQKNQAELTKAIAGYAWESARQMFEKCHLSKKAFVTLMEKKSTEDQSE